MTMITFSTAPVNLFNNSNRGTCGIMFFSSSSYEAKDNVMTDKYTGFFFFYGG